MIHRTDNQDYFDDFGDDSDFNRVPEFMRNDKGPEAKKAGNNTGKSFPRKGGNFNSWGSKNDKYILTFLDSKLQFNGSKFIVSEEALRQVAIAQFTSMSKEIGGLGVAEISGEPGSPEFTVRFVKAYVCSTLAESGYHLASGAEVGKVLCAADADGYDPSKVIIFWHTHPFTRTTPTPSIVDLANTENLIKRGAGYVSCIFSGPEVYARYDRGPEDEYMRFRMTPSLDISDETRSTIDAVPITTKDSWDFGVGSGGGYYGSSAHNTRYHGKGIVPVASGGRNALLDRTDSGLAAKPFAESVFVNVKRSALNSLRQATNYSYSQMGFVESDLNMLAADPVVKANKSMVEIIDRMRQVERTFLGALDRVDEELTDLGIHKITK